MKKCKLLSIAILLALAVSCVAIPSAFVSAEESDRPVNVLANKGEWAHNAGSGAVAFSDGGLLITPIGIVGTAYTGAVFGQGKIAFTYQLEYAEGVDPFTPDTPEYQCFFGVLFGNSPADVTVPNGTLSTPWSAPGGYPYMLAFDSETQGGEDNRLKQLGLTLRRYQATGSHDYTRWSSVDPTEETFVNTAGQSYESKVPAFYKAVPMDVCFNAAEHSVEIEIKNLYKATGDEVDAVRIDVTFDGEKCLTVIDEMPFEGEELGDAIDVDKRTSDGYIAWYAYDGFNENNIQMWDYKIHVKSMDVTFGQSNGGALPVNPTEPKQTGCGCGGNAAASSLAAALGALLCGAAVAVICKRNGHRTEQE